MCPNISHNWRFRWYVYLASELYNMHFRSHDVLRGQQFFTNTFLMGFATYFKSSATRLPRWDYSAWSLQHDMHHDLFQVRSRHWSQVTFQNWHLHIGQIIYYHSMRLDERKTLVCDILLSLLSRKLLVDSDFGSFSLFRFLFAAR